MAEDSFSIGERTDSRFRESVVSQLSAIAARLNVHVAQISAAARLITAAAQHRASAAPVAAAAPVALAVAR